MKNKHNCYFRTEISPQIGDKVATGSFGECRVLEIGEGEINCENIITKETLWCFTDDCDLIS